MRERRNDIEFTQLQGNGGDFTAQLGQVIFIVAPHLFEQSVHAQPLEEGADLTRGALWQQGMYSAGGEPANRKLAAQHEAQDRRIRLGEQVEPFVAMRIFRAGLREALQFLHADFNASIPPNV